MPREKLRILCVDDEPLILRALERELRREPYEVVTASGGSDAIAAIKAAPTAVVVSDEHMPGLGGVALLQWVKESSPRTIRILLTQHFDDPNVTIPAINCAACFWFLRKPWDAEELRAVLREACERYARTEPVSERAREGAP